MSRDINEENRIAMAERRIETAKLIRSGKYKFADGTFYRPNNFQVKISYAPINPIHKAKRKNPPSQPTPITVDNFHIASYGIFAEIFSIPQGFKSIFKSKGSEYFTNEEKTIIIRESDHWGGEIKHCQWFLSGYNRITSWRWQKYYGKGKRIGMIEVSRFKPQQRAQPEPESRHPF